MFLMKLSTAATIEVGPCLDSAGAEYTGLVIGDLRLVKAGTGAAMAASATLTHVANGHYTLVLTTTNTDTLGTLTVSCHKSTYQMPRVLMMVVPVKVYDSIVAGSDNLEVDAIQLLGTAFANPTTAGLMDVNAKQFGGATVNATTSVTIPASSTLATTAGAVGSVTGAVSSVTNAVTVGTINADVVTASALATDAVNEIVDQVWDELLSGHTGAGSTGAGLSSASSAGDPWSTALPGSYGAGTAGKIVGDNVNATISSRASQTSLDTLDDYVDTEVGAIKTKTDQLVFTVANQVDSNSLSVSATGIRTAVGMNSANLDSQISGLATPTNITAATGITVSSIGADAITASALATDAVNEIVDQVWDELLSGHTGAGSTGAGLSSASSAGDPWSTALPGSYGAGTAGKIVGDNVNATISSRASQTSLDTLDDYVDTEVGAIKTKTDQLVFTVANQVDSNSLSVSATGIRTAVGMNSANLDSQISGLATPTNITTATGIVLSPVTHTGARIPNVTLTDTTTNLTNAPTSGDLTATMKSSVTAAVPTAAQNFAAVLTTALTESYAADNTAPTLAQAIMLIQQSLHEFAINSTTRTVKKLDGSTTAATFILDSATAPTSTTRAT